MGELVYLTGAQAGCLMSQANGLYYNRGNGEYLKHLGENKYEVVISPYIEDEPFWRSLYDDGLISANMLYQHVPCIENFSVVNEFNLRLKEKEMEIGGNMCHLCGEEMLHNGISRTMVKKHRNVESHQVYMCGTSIFTTWKERDCDMDCFDSKRDRHIHAECITHCCE